MAGDRDFAWSEPDYFPCARSDSLLGDGRKRGLGANNGSGRHRKSAFFVDVGSGYRRSGDGIPDEVRVNDRQLHGVGDGERSGSAVDGVIGDRDESREVFLRSVSIEFLRRVGEQRRSVFRCRNRACGSIRLTDSGKLG